MGDKGLIFCVWWGFDGLMNVIWVNVWWRCGVKEGV